MTQHSDPEQLQAAPDPKVDVRWAVKATAKRIRETIESDMEGFDSPFAVIAMLKEIERTGVA